MGLPHPAYAIAGERWSARRSGLASRWPRRPGLAGNPRLARWGRLDHPLWPSRTALTATAGLAWAEVDGLLARCRDWLYPGPAVEGWVLVLARPGEEQHVIRLKVRPPVHQKPLPRPPVVQCVGWEASLSIICVQCPQRKTHNGTSVEL